MPASSLEAPLGTVLHPAARSVSEGPPRKIRRRVAQSRTERSCPDRSDAWPHRPDPLSLSPGGRPRPRGLGPRARCAPTPLCLRSALPAPDGSGEIVSERSASPLCGPLPESTRRISGFNNCCADALERTFLASSGTPLRSLTLTPSAITLGAGISKSDGAISERPRGVTLTCVCACVCVELESR